MPRLTPDRSPIARLRVVDRVQDETTICQVATLRTVNLSHGANGVFSVTITVWVSQHSYRAGEPGDELAGSPGRALTFAGDNLTLVDAATGEQLATRTAETNEQWQLIENGFEQVTMWQGDFLLAMMRSGPVNIPDLVLYHMARANSPILNRYA
jgi:hypothetical protein